MTNTFTESPWHVEIDPGGGLFVTNEKRQHVCVIQKRRSVDETAANASLIAAAPGLLRCTRFLRLVCQDRLSMLAEESEPDEEVVEHYRLLEQDANDALALLTFNSFPTRL